MVRFDMRPAPSLAGDSRSCAWSTEEDIAGPARRQRQRILDAVSSQARQVRALDEGPVPRSL